MHSRYRAVDCGDHIGRALGRPFAGSRPPRVGRGDNWRPPLKLHQAQDKLAPSSMALRIDQIPESLLPAIAARWALPVTVLDAAILAGLFFIGELAASRVLFALNIRDRPY